MYNFLNDYSDLCHPKILDALVSIKDEDNVGYGFDDHSENARNILKKILEDDDLDIHFVSGGTIANIIGTTMGLRGQDSILSCTSGHIQGHEAGAIEATGAKIELIYSEDGKITPEMLDEKLEDFGPEFMTVPKTVYISNTTELGSVYSLEELEALYAKCRDHGLYLFIDGARLAHALVSDAAGGLSLKDMPRVCDGFTIGGTKNGILFGEALVVKNKDLRADLINLIKQKGALLAKGFVLGVQFEAMFEDKDLYLDLARKAYTSAMDLARGLEKKGYRMYLPPESNQIFTLVDEDEFNRIEEFAQITPSEKIDGKILTRFVTTYRTTQDDISGFLEKL